LYCTRLAHKPDSCHSALFEYRSEREPLVSGSPLRSKDWRVLNRAGVMVPVSERQATRSVCPDCGKTVRLSAPNLKRV
jgi:hypothetical protein